MIKGSAQARLFSAVGGGGVVVVSVLLAGCLAQQADLRKQQADLQRTNKELQSKIKSAKDEVDQMVKETRARLNEQIRNVIEQELPSIRGDIQSTAHQSTELVRRQEDRMAVLEQNAQRRESEQRARFNALEAKLEKEFREQSAGLKQEVTAETAKSSVRLDTIGVRLEEVAGRLDALGRTMGTLTQKIDTRIDEQQKGIQATDSRIHQQEAQNKSLNDQIAKLTHSLADFKQALAVMGDKLVQEEQHSKQLAATMDQHVTALNRRSEALAAKVDNDTKSVTGHVNEANKVMMGHLAEVNRSVATVARALETAGEKFSARLDEQDRRLEQIAKAVDDVNKDLVQLRSVPRTVRSQPMERTQPSSGEAQAAMPQPTEGGAEQDSLTPSQPVSVRPSGTEQPAPRNDREAYERILNRFKEGDLEGARQGFTQFLVEYPNSELSPNARFWLGESYYGKKEYRKAIDAYDKVELDYPNSDKVPAAILKKGFAYLALKDRKRASSAFKQVVTLYPKSPEAGKASDKLSQLKEPR